MTRKKRPAPAPEPPLCCECGSVAALVQSQKIYPHRPDLWNRPMWLCECGAYCGCHQGTEQSLGRPAGPATRKARQAAHKYFDRLWQRKMARDQISKTKARGAGYLWLADQLDLDPEDCHIASMTRAYAQRAADICRRFTRD